MKKTKDKKTQTQKESINLNNEIIIGLTPKKEEKEENKQNLKNKKRKPVKQKRKTSAKKQSKSKKTINFQLIKWTSIIILLILIIVIFMRSPVFNIKEIKVENNSKISTEEIINLSTLKVGNNMFNYSNKAVKNGIKLNAYIEDVKIKKNIKGIVTLQVTERKPTYMLKFGNSYVYINNQGYMLEIAENPLELPIITGFETPIEEITEGNRLIENDLKKLDDVIKIMNSASEIGFANTITSIDITNKLNYILGLTSENKTVQFGDTKNINVKILKIKEILEKEKGISGEIYFQDMERTVFKENV